MEKVLEGEGIVPYCPRCQQYRFPMYNVAVSMIVTDEETGKVLLIQQYGKPTYILVAGYVNQGEAEEDAVVREVLEETGLHVKNLRFYKSQPWTFTDTLLFGFFAELDGSDKITVQEDELAEAGWFHRSEIPEDQSRISLTGEMMEQFRKGLA